MSNPAAVDATVRRALADLHVVDVHTHLFDPSMGDLLACGIDELLTYHYHVAELFRVRPDLAPEEFWRMPVPARADLVWRELFVERLPVSEVGRGVVELLTGIGLDASAPDLRAARDRERGRDRRAWVDDVLALARVREVCMTNDPLDPGERAIWLRGFERDPRFVAALRLDSALMGWPDAVAALRALGYDVDASLGARSVAELRRYLREWARRFDARYLAISLPPRLDYPGSQQPWLRLLVAAVIPEAVELGLPVALMIGVRRAVNPRLRLAGDGVGAVDVESIEALAADHPRARILVTTLSRESQHALCVAARKFSNLVPFGAWWFMNNEALFAETTRMRLDMLGPSFVPQHSDARVLEQLVFKWVRSRRWLGDVLAGHYADLARAGRAVAAAEVERDLDRMLGAGVWGAGMFGA